MRPIGPIVTKLLLERKWTQAELAERANMIPGHLSEIIKGEKRPGDKTAFTTLEKIAKAFGVSVAVFSDYEEVPPLYPHENKLLRLFRKLRDAHPERTQGVLDYIEFTIGRCRREDRKINAG